MLLYYCLVCYADVIALFSIDAQGERGLPGDDGPSGPAGSRVSIVHNTVHSSHPARHLLWHGVFVLISKQDNSCTLLLGSSGYSLSV